MKIKVTQKAWYKKCLVDEGQIIDYTGDKVPRWGTLAGGESVSELEPPAKPVQEESEKLEKLELLREMAIDNEIWIESLGADATVEEEIDALEAELKAKGVIKE